MSVDESPTIIHEYNGIAQIQLGYIKLNVTKHITSKFFYTHELKENEEVLVTLDHVTI
jgi:hypothetical protein